MPWKKSAKKVKKPVTTFRKLNYWIIIVYCIYSVQLYLSAIWWLNTHCTWPIIDNASALKQHKWWQMFFLCTVHCLIRWMLVSEIDGFYSLKVHRILTCARRIRVDTGHGKLGKSWNLRISCLGLDSYDI